MRRRLALLALLALAAAGCGDDESGGPAGGDQATVALDLSFSDGSGTRPRATLGCGEEGAKATGWLSERGAPASCAEARRLADFLASEPEEPDACTQIYGGPQRARVTGSVAGMDIDRVFSRRNGCEIADWERVQPLLPEVTGVR